MPPITSLTEAAECTNTIISATTTLKTDLANFRAALQWVHYDDGCDDATWGSRVGLAQQHEQHIQSRVGLGTVRLDDLRDWVSGRDLSRCPVSTIAAATVADWDGTLYEIATEVQGFQGFLSQWGL